MSFHFHSGYLIMPTLENHEMDELFNEHCTAYPAHGSGMLAIMPREQFRAALEKHEAALQARWFAGNHTGKSGPHEPESAAGAPAPGQHVADSTSGVVLLPDGSAFAIMSTPLPKDHWLYAPRTYELNKPQYEPDELPEPILGHQHRDAVVAAVRYAVRGATMCGTEPDFDPDALVGQAVYALCGPYSRASADTGNGPPSTTRQA